jgi:hypothetical protein
MADDALHFRKSPTQRALDLVDILVDIDHAHRGRGAAMEIHDLARLGIAHPHIMDVMDRGIRGETRQRVLDSFNTFRSSVDANGQFGLQRLDVGVDLDIFPEFVPDVPLQLMGDAVGCCERHVAVDLKIDADGQSPAEIVHGHMVHGQTGIAGNHHDTFTHALVIARDWNCGECQVRIVEHSRDVGLGFSFDLLDPIDRIGAWHLHDGINEVG